MSLAFIEFVKKFILKNKAKLSTKTKQVLNKFLIITKIYRRDSKFTAIYVISKIHPTGGTHLTLYKKENFSIPIYVHHQKCSRIKLSKELERCFFQKRKPMEETVTAPFLFVCFLWRKQKKIVSAVLSLYPNTERQLEKKTKKEKCHIYFSREQYYN